MPDAPPPDAAPLPPYRIKGLMTDRIPVYLDRWEWFYFLGWLEARRAFAETESEQIGRVVETIAQAAAAGA